MCKEVKGVLDDLIIGLLKEMGICSINQIISQRLKNKIMFLNYNRCGNKNRVLHYHSVSFFLRRVIHSDTPPMIFGNSAKEKRCLSSCLCIYCSDTRRRIAR